MVNFVCRRWFSQGDRGRDAADLILDRGLVNLGTGSGLGLERSVNEVAESEGGRNLGENWS